MAGDTVLRLRLQVEEEVGLEGSERPALVKLYCAGRVLAASSCILLAVRAARCNFARTELLHLPARSRLGGARVSLPLARRPQLSSAP